MFTRLRIENFKGWKDTGIIKMAPITLFFGPNSSGKSSIGQFLMMLKQTVESADRKAVLYPGGKNSAVQLGSYQQMVFQRNTQSKIAFDYEWELSRTLRIKNPKGRSYSGNAVSFDAEIGLADKDAFIKWVLDHQWGFPYEDHVVINKEGDSYSEFPNTKDLSQFDPADKKFVAVAKAHPEGPPIFQATDSKWWGWKDALAREGVTVSFLCPDYVAVLYEKKRTG